MRLPLVTKWQTGGQQLPGGSEEQPTAGVPRGERPCCGAARRSPQQTPVLGCSRTILFSIVEPSDGQRMIYERSARASAGCACVPTAAVTAAQTLQLPVKLRKRALCFLKTIAGPVTTDTLNTVRTLKHAASMLSWSLTQASTLSLACILAFGQMAYDAATSSERQTQLQLTDLMRARSGATADVPCLSCAFISRLVPQAHPQGLSGDGRSCGRNSGTARWRSWRRWRAR